MPLRVRFLRLTALLCAAPLLALLAAEALAAGKPAVARPRYQAAGEWHGSGTAFFLSIPGKDGAVAVTSAHTLDLAQLAETPELQFLSGQAGNVLSVSSRFYARPGRPFTAGGPLSEDYLIFALDVPLIAGRALTADTDPYPSRLEGKRVRLLGVPASGASDEDDIFGTVTLGRHERIEVRLDVPHDLRGWGGAPVLRYPGGTVIGILEAAYTDEAAGTYRLGVAPISGVLRALRLPYDGGLGRPFADAGAGAAPRGEQGVGDSARDQALPPAPRAPGLQQGELLLGSADDLTTSIELAIECPAEGDYIGDEEGGFVAGRAVALIGELRRFDVAIVIDTSDTAADASGADINGNGVVGRNRFGFISDSGDSILAAEVAAAKRVLEKLDPRNTRVSVISFSGTESVPGAIVLGRRRPDATTEQRLTADYDQVRRALDHVQERGTWGLTNMSEAIRTALRELKGFSGSLSTPDPDSEKIILFFTDGKPTLPYPRGYEQLNVRSVIRAASQARRAGIRIHSFALGPEALDSPIATVEMASVTGGIFTPVRRPGDLVEVIENVSFANIEVLEVQNTSTGESALEISMAADGSFASLVPLRTGLNQLSVRVVASDGTEGRDAVTVSHAPGVRSPRLPRDLMKMRGRLLERRLIVLKRDNIQTERENAERRKQQLRLKVEAERESARKRSERQRRRLNIDVEEGEIAPPDGAL